MEVRAYRRVAIHIIARTMPRHAQSQTLHAQLESQFLHEWINIAADRYNAERQSNNRCKKGVRKICQDVQGECFVKTKRTVKLAPNTVLERAKGRKSIRDFNAEKRWMEEGEEDAVVDFVIDCARRGFPVSHKRLKEHVDLILRARLGERFPVEGVGQQWTQRFVERNHKRLSRYWTHSLDNSRARAVNPANHKAYFDLLEKVLKGEDGEDPIADECIYGMDETGLQQGVGVKERVIGPAGEHVQYQQQSGDCENITVLVTICADGTSIPPAVIYKGEAYQSSWKQDNPLNAS